MDFWRIYFIKGFGDFFEDTFGWLGFPVDTSWGFVGYRLTFPLKEVILLNGNPMHPLRLGFRRPLSFLV